MGNHRKNKRSHTKRFVTIAAGAGVLTIGGAIVNTGVASAHDWSQVVMCEFRRLEHQHRQRLLRRTSIHAVDVGCIQTGRCTGSRRLGVDSRSSRGRGSNPLSSRHRRVAGMWRLPRLGRHHPDSTTSARSSVGSAGDTVTVSEGDTLFNLAAAKGIRWQDVWVMNAWIADPDQIRVGDVIRF